MFSHFQKYQKYGFSAAITIALLALSIVPFYVNADFHDTQRLISTLFFAGALCFTICSAQVSKVSVYLISAAYVWGLMAVFSSPLPLWSFVEFGLLFSVVLIGICLMPKIIKEQLQQLAFLLVVIHVFYILHNLTDYTMYMTTGSQFTPYSLANGFSGVRFYGQFLVWTLPFLLGILATNPKQPYRNAVLLILMFDWAFELLTFTRAFLVAMVVTLPALFWFAQENWREYAKWFFITAVGGVALYVIMLFAIPKLLGHDGQYAIMQSAGRDMFNSSGRIQLWLDASQQVFLHPWLGAGPMMTALTSVSSISAHPHNFVLQLLAEWGIPFTVILLGFATLGLVRWRKIIRTNKSARIDFALPVTASLVAGAAAGLFDGIIVMPVSMVYMAIMFALLGGLWRKFTPDVERKRFPTWMLPILLIPSIFVAVFAIVNWPYWNLNAPLDLQNSKNANQSNVKRNPRFWIAGHISVDKVNH